MRFFHLIGEAYFNIQTVFLSDNKPYKSVRYFSV